MIQKERSCCWAIIGDNKALTSEFGPSQIGTYKLGPTWDHIIQLN